MGKGVIGIVGTTLVFNTDSTIIVYKGVSEDTIVYAEPFVYALGTYQIQKEKDTNRVTLNATKRGGEPYVYTGTYDKKIGVMIFDVPNSTTKETYVRNPKVKVKN